MLSGTSLHGLTDHKTSWNDVSLKKIDKKLKNLHNFANLSIHEMNRNESGFRPLLCTYRLNWARRTSWGWWNDWDDTVLQTQDSKFEPWRSEAEHATFRSRRLPTILTFTRGWGRNICCFFQTAETGNQTDRQTFYWQKRKVITDLFVKEVKEGATLRRNNSSNAG